MLKLDSMHHSEIILNFQKKINLQWLNWFSGNSSNISRNVKKHSKNDLYEYEQKTWNRREETEKMGEQYENFYLVFFNLLTPPSYATSSRNNVVYPTSQFHQSPWWVVNLLLSLWKERENFKFAFNPSCWAYFHRGCQNANNPFERWMTC